MNIMSVSVAERISEIGIRMAIGARQPDIRNQFLLEARMLSVISGIIGIVVRLLGGFALTQGLGFLFVFSVVALSLHSAFLPLLVSALASIQQYVRQNLSMLIGFLLGLMITRATGLPFVITAISLLLPFIICSIIGVVFGLYPAIRASSLDPIVALRTE